MKRKKQKIPVFDKPIKTKKELELKKPSENAQKEVENRLLEDVYFLRKQLEKLKNENIDLKKSYHNSRKRKYGLSRMSV